MSVLPTLDGGNVVRFATREDAAAAWSEGPGRGTLVVRPLRAVATTLQLSVTIEIPGCARIAVRTEVIDVDLTKATLRVLSGDIGRPPELDTPSAPPPSAPPPSTAPPSTPATTTPPASPATTSSTPAAPWTVLAEHAAGALAPAASASPTPSASVAASNPFLAPSSSATPRNPFATGSATPATTPEGPKNPFRTGAAAQTTAADPASAFLTGAAAKTSAPSGSRNEFLTGAAAKSTTAATEPPRNPFQSGAATTTTTTTMMMMYKHIAYSTDLLSLSFHYFKISQEKENNNNKQTDQPTNRAPPATMGAKLHSQTNQKPKNMI